MNRFPTSSIGQLLGVGFGLMFLLLGVLGLAVFIWHSESATAQREFLERIAPLAEQADELERTVLRVSIEGRAYLLNPERGRFNQYRKASDSAREALRRLEQAPQDADGATLIRQISKRVGDYVAQTDHLIERHLTKAVEGAEENQLAGMRGRAVESLQRFLDLQRGKRAAALATMQTARNRVSSGIVAAIVLGGLLAAAIAWVTTQSVRRPVSELVAVAGALEAGDWSPAAALVRHLSTEPAPQSRGEMRRLARAIGNAAVALEQREQRLQAQHEELQSQYEEIQAQSEELQAQHEEIQAQNEQLKQQATELGEADQRKNRFLGVLAHELRNPMAPISNSLALLKRAPPGSEPALRAQAMIERQTRHLIRLIDDLLDITRISQGKIRLQREELDLVEIVRACIEDQHAILEEGERDLRFEATQATARLSGDRTRLSQVVGNLLSNAVKFTDRGGRIAVTLNVDEKTRTASLSVADNGIGIEPELLPRLFEPFTQGSAGLDRANGGLGLGLSLVHALVELHGGQTEARSGGSGRGAEFIVRLPLGA